MSDDSTHADATHDETWNAAIEKVAALSEKAWMNLLVYTWNEQGKLVSMQPCKDMPATIRAMKRAVP